MDYKTFKIGDYVKISLRNKNDAWFTDSTMTVVGFHDSGKYDVFLNNIFYIKEGCRFMFIYNGMKKGVIIDSENLPLTKVRIECSDGSTYDILKSKLTAQLIRSDYIELDKKFIREKKIDKILNEE